VSDSPSPLWKEIPLPLEEDRRLFEEWKKRREREECEQEKEDDRVIVIQL